MKLILLKIYLFLSSLKIQNILIISLFLIISFPIFPQRNYELVEEQEYTEYYEKPIYVPDVRFTGSFNAYYQTKRGAQGVSEIDDDSTSDNFWKYDFYLNIRSEVNRNISLNVSIKNPPYDVGDSSNSYRSYNREERKSGGTVGDQNISVIIHEAYLEYDYNQCPSILRFGQQELNLGDYQGLVFRGNHAAISQKCKIGTWPYYIGGAKLGPSENDSLYWAQLNYPVYASNIKITDPWKKIKRDQESLNIEIFRVLHREFDLALGKYGGSTWTPTSGNTNPYQSTNGTDSIYYDAREEYQGIILNWSHHDFFMNLTYVGLTGDRKYHTSTQISAEPYDTLSEIDISGYVYSLEFEYHYDYGYKQKVNFKHFSASGDDANDQNPWERDQITEYFEITKGTYGNAKVYFNGYNQTGEGHSVSNVTFNNIGYSVLFENGTFEGDLQYYQFFKSKPVTNDAGKKVQSIGSEIDVSLTWWLEKKLSLTFSLAAFQVNAAYSPTDNLAPREKRLKDFSFFSTSLDYNF